MKDRGEEVSELLVPFTLRLPDASLRDCAASQGTPLSEALDSVGVDPAWFQLCRISGGLVKPADRIGFEVAAGEVIMFVADPSAMLTQGRWASRAPNGGPGGEGDAAARNRAVPGGTLVGSALVIVLVELFVLAGPFLWDWRPGLLSRLVTGALGVLYALVLAYVAPAWARTQCVATASAVFALSCLQIVPADNPVGAAVAPVVMAWGGLLFCLAYRMRRVEDVEDAVAVPRAAWMVATACTTLMVLGGSLVARPAFLAVAAGTVLVWLSPQLTMRSSSFVLIDIKEVLTSALPGRQQDPPRPKAMNARTSRAAYSSARVRSHVVIALGCAMCVLGGLMSGSHVGAGEWRGRAALATVLGAALSLAFTARHQRSGGRLLMTGASVLLAALVAASPEVSAHVPGGSAVLLAGAAFLIAVLFPLRGAGGGRRKRMAPSPLVGRILDVLQALILIVVLPASVYASGLFDAIRQSM